MPTALRARTARARHSAGEEEQGAGLAHEVQQLQVCRAGKGEGSGLRAHEASVVALRNGIIYGASTDGASSLTLSGTEIAGDLGGPSRPSEVRS
jgi:hypothetical protein